jgi:hypothetical protein
MGADVSTIEHTGATSFTISSSGTDGSVSIESVNVDAGVVTGVTALTTDSLLTGRLKFTKTEVSAAASIALDMSSASSYVEVTDDGASASNALSISNAAEGQVLVVKNLDAQDITINTAGDDQVTISSKTAQMFVYEGAVWEPLSFAGAAGTRRLAAMSRSGIYSDERLKTNVMTISNALDKLHRIRGVSFDYAAPSTVRDLMVNHLPEDGTKSVGVLAQEIERVLPELVKTDAQGYKSVEYANLAGFLIQVNKEQETKMEQMEKEQETKMKQMEKEQETKMEQMKLVIAVLAVAIIAILILGIALFRWVKKKLDQQVQRGERKSPLS